MAGMTPTNYDITNATMGFDMGTAMGQWMIRTDSTWGSLGANLIYNGGFSSGTNSWSDSQSNTLFMLSTLFTLGRTDVMGVGGDATSATLSGAAIPMAGGTYIFSVDVLGFHNITAATLTKALAPSTMLPMISFANDLWTKIEDFSTKNILSTTVPKIMITMGDNGTVALDNITMRKQFATSNFQIMGGTMGVYRYSFLPEDTENLAATSYYFDIWMRTPQNKEYTITVGTIQLLPVVGTM
jgi:hypothetical protein